MSKEKLIEIISRAHGESIFPRPSEISVISTGSPRIDRAIGVGGVPRGRITEIFGMEGSGKTTLCYHIMANAQREGLTCLFVDTEHAFDADYAQRIGVQEDELLILQPDYAEQALETVSLAARSGEAGVIILDSVAALATKAELEGSLEDTNVAVLARLMSQHLRILAGEAAKSKVAIIYTNQMRDKIGGMGYGPQYTQPGGRALKFYSSLRLEVARVQNLKRGDETIGQTIKVIVRKNKLAPPAKTATTDIIFGEGISVESEIIEDAIKAGVIKKAGPYLKLGDQSLARGKEELRSLLRTDPAFKEQLLQLLRDHELQEVA